MAPTEYRLLGPLEVSAGDRDLPVRGRRQRALLAFLLLHANEVVPTERLLRELWRNEEPVSGAAAIHVRVSQLRRALDPGGGGPIVTQAPGYALRADADDIDFRRFERLLGEGRALLGAGDAGEACGRLSAALGLWRGPALVDVRDEPFAEAEIARLEELRLTALEHRLEADLALGRHAEIVAELEGLAAAHPHRERVRGQLMLALYRSGRQADALESYREGRRSLVDSLGLEPGEDLRRLHQAILRQDPTLAPPAAPGRAAPRHRPAPPTEERKLVTTLFADLVASTELVGSHDPERARLLLDRYADAMASEIEDAGGTLEKFVGDAIMAIFGAPRAHEDHAERALHAALAMRSRLDELFEGELSLRIGVATGEVAVGQSRGEGSYATGLAVNAGARLAQVAAPGEILVATRTARATSAFEFAEPTIVEAPGIPGGIECRSLVRALALTQPRRIGGRETDLIGRAPALDALTTTYGRVVAARRPSLVTVMGDAGVGKSRLARELWTWLAAQSPEPLRRTCRCLPADRRIAYGPLRDVLQEELGLLSTDPPDVARQRLGEREILGLALGLEAGVDLHPLAARERLREAWVDFLRQLTTNRPVVLLVEDVHWAQELLVELLEAALREVQGPLLVVATARPELADRWPAWGRGVPDASTIWLDPLSGAETELLLEQLLGAEVPSGVRELLVTASEGNPFFTEELLASLVDRGVLAQSGEGWTVGDAELELPVPDSVQSVVAARIDLLPPTEKTALQAASVIGRIFWRGAVEDLLEGALPDVATLEARDFVRRRPLSSRAGQRELAFKHALTREVAYGTLPKGERARLHARYADWLERTGGGDEDAPFLAHHYAEAVRPENLDLAWSREPAMVERLRERALGWLGRAAELAVCRYEIDAGLGLLHRALELEERAAERSRLWRTIGHANALKHDGEAFWAAMESAIEAAPDQASRADLYSELAYETSDRWGMLRRPTDLSLLEGWTEQALELAAPGTAARATALAALVWANPDEREAAREALEIAERLDEPKLLYAALEAQRIVSFAEGDFEAAVGWDDRRLGLLPRLAEADARADVYLTSAPSFLASGRVDEARRIARLHDEIAQTLTPHHRVHGVALLVEIEEVTGDWAAVRALESRAVETIEANADTPCVRNPRTLLACAAASAYLGDVARAREVAGRADVLGTDPPQFRDVLAVPRLRLALGTGDRAAAEALLDALPRPGHRWLRRGRAMGLQALVTFLDALVFLGRRDEIEQEAPRLAAAGAFLEPFALRALGSARGDVALVERAAAGFEALGLGRQADETRRLVADASGRPPQP